jgi:hypothetical protein
MQQLQSLHQQQQHLHHPQHMHHQQQQQLPPMGPYARAGPRIASLVSVGSGTGSIGGHSVLGRYSSLHKRGGSMDMGEQGVEAGANMAN